MKSLSATMQLKAIGYYAVQRGSKLWVCETIPFNLFFNFEDVTEAEGMALYSREATEAGNSLIEELDAVKTQISQVRARSTKTKFAECSRVWTWETIEGFRVRRAILAKTPQKLCKMCRVSPADFFHFVCSMLVFNSIVLAWSGSYGQFL